MNFCPVLSSGHAGGRYRASEINSRRIKKIYDMASANRIERAVLKNTMAEEKHACLPGNLGTAPRIMR